MIAVQTGEPQREAPEAEATPVPKYTAENLPCGFSTFDEEGGLVDIVLDNSEYGLFINIYDTKGKIYDFMGRSDITLYYLQNIMGDYFYYSKEVVAAAEVLQKDGILDHQCRSTQYGAYDSRKFEGTPSVEDDEEQEERQGQKEGPMRPAVVRRDKEVAGPPKPPAPRRALDAA